MPKLLPLKASSHSVEIERLRRAIPVSGYLTLLHAAATTGSLPILDMNGHPTGEFSKLESRDRLALLTKLVDKAMPDRQEAPMLPEDSGNSKTIDVRNLSDEELEILANAKPTTALPAPDYPGTPGHTGAASDAPSYPSDGSSDPGDPGTETSCSGQGTPEA